MSLTMQEELRIIVGALFRLLQVGEGVVVEMEDKKWCIVNQGDDLGILELDDDATVFDSQQNPVENKSVKDGQMLWFHNTENEEIV